MNTNIIKYPVSAPITTTTDIANFVNDFNQSLGREQQAHIWMLPSANRYGIAIMPGPVYLERSFPAPRHHGLGPGITIEQANEADEQALKHFNILRSYGIIVPQTYTAMTMPQDYLWLRSLVKIETAAEFVAGDHFPHQDTWGPDTPHQDKLIHLGESLLDYFKRVVNGDYKYFLSDVVRIRQFIVTQGGQVALTDTDQFVLHRSNSAVLMNKLNLLQDWLACIPDKEASARLSQQAFHLIKQVREQSVQNTNRL